MKNLQTMLYNFQRNLGKQYLNFFTLHFQFIKAGTQQALSYELKAVKTAHQTQLGKTVLF
jgi:hypothetical protein